ncbi:hypothetical protein BH23ACT10_BH23ACT10_00420 [soil metagenome]
MSITAIIPLKALHRSKQRLAAHLAADERQALIADLFTRVVRVCSDTPAVTSVCAVVGDDAGATLARDAGAAVVRETTGGLNAAVREATDRVAGDAALVVVADLPRLTVSDLTSVTAAGRRGPCVVVARTHDGGTGALLRQPPGVIAPAFGGSSAAAHLTAAQRAGVRAILVSSAGLAHDVDRPGDLRLASDGPPWDL